jgi:hypothetical protein
MSDLTSTRLSLHALAELVLAGPQFAAHGEIALRVTSEGFSTVKDPVVAVAGTTLVTPDAVVDLDGERIADVAAKAGVEPRALNDVYSDGSGLNVDHVLQIDAAAAAEILKAFRRGDDALATFAPEETRILWPEHFDVGISRGEVNYGVSPGDSYLDVPYAYVGPWNREGLAGPFWNAPFGSARPVSEIGDLVGYFAEGSEAVRSR